MSTRSKRLAVAVAGLAVIAGSLVLGGEGAGAAVGQNPVGCASATTWASQSFNIAGDHFLLEERHSYPCNAGWGRLTITGGTAVGVILSAWNPGQPSEYTVPNTNYTYEVNASPGRQVCAGFTSWNYNQFGQQINRAWHFGGCYNT